MTLKIDGLRKRFGDVQALDGVTFDVRPGEVYGFLGANGAGKTTLFSMIGGAEKPTSGTITFEGRCINGMRPSKIAQLGVARTFQIVRPLGRLTVLQNVMVGAYCRVTRTSAAREISLNWLEYTGLLHRKDALAREVQKRIWESACYIPTWQQAYFRIAYWRWLKWPTPPGTRAMRSAEAVEARCRPAGCL